MGHHLTCDICNRVRTTVFRQKLKQEGCVLSDEEGSKAVATIRRMQENGYAVHLVAVQPDKCLITPPMLKEDVSRLWGTYDGWESMQSPAELFETLTLREKQMLPLLALHNNKKVAKLTGLKLSYVSTIRKRINSKTYCNSPLRLRLFYNLLSQRGIAMPPLTPKRSKKKRVG